MTFEEFQATRTHCDDIGAAISADLGEKTAGNLYCGTFYIEARADWWTPQAKAQGAWYLILERDDYISDDLESLERKLYEFAKDYGAFA